jgi:hypothetical protein
VNSNMNSTALNINAAGKELAQLADAALQPFVRLAGLKDVFIHLQRGSMKRPATHLDAYQCSPGWWFFEVGSLTMEVSFEGTFLWRRTAAVVAGVTAAAAALIVR